MQLGVKVPFDLPQSLSVVARYRLPALDTVYKSGLKIGHNRKIWKNRRFGSLISSNEYLLASIKND